MSDDVLGTRWFESPRLGVVWGGVGELTIPERYQILRELASDVQSARLDRLSPHRAIDSALISLNHAADALGHAPTEYEYRELGRQRPEIGLMPASTVRRVLGGILWSDCLRLALLEAPSEGEFAPLVRGSAYEELEILDALRDCAASLGHVPTADDYLAWTRDPRVVDRPGRRPRSLKPFERRGGFGVCLVRAGLADRAATHRVDKSGRVLPLEYGFTDDEICAAVQDLAAQLGRTPTPTDYAEARKRDALRAHSGEIVDVIPTIRTVYRRFGPWANVITAADLPPLESSSDEIQRIPRRRARYSNEERLEGLRKAWVDVGDPLTMAAYDRWRRERIADARAAGAELFIPTSRSICDALGGWKAAVRAVRPGSTED